ncbi:Exopolyphosphatase [Phlyctochytrium bullatum]|nr:Exopolyphosphatase [Phlyctochytrium bullatum]
MSSSKLSPLLGFLRHAKSVLASAATLTPAPKLTLVIGNEAADLDSIVSAISYAFLKHCTHQPAKPDEHREFVPVIHVPRKDLALRTDCTYAFSRSFPGVDVASSHFNFIDELDLDALNASNDLRLILTDHNRLAPSLSKYSDRVDGILDHHKDEQLHLNASPRVIEPVGSATSLIALEWQKSNHLTESLDSSLAVLMLAPILLDTINLEQKFGRCTDKDVEASKFLLLKSGIPENQIQTFSKDYFEDLQNAKFDCSGLSNEDLLKKDYKEVVVKLPGTRGEIKFGISSVTWFLDAWAQREGGNLDSVLASIKQFSSSQKLDIALVMLAFNHKDTTIGFQRELLVLVSPFMERDSGLAAKFISEMEAKGSELDLETKKIPCKDLGSELFAYVQRNGKMSRKLLLPVVERIVSQFSDEELARAKFT